MYIKRSHGNVIVPRFLQGSGFQKRLEDKANPIASQLRKKIATAIMILYRNAKSRSPDRYSGFFDIVAGDLKGDRLAPDLFIICLYYIHGTLIAQIKEYVSTFKKKQEADDILQKL